MLKMLWVQFIVCFLKVPLSPTSLLLPGDEESPKTDVVIAEAPSAPGPSTLPGEARPTASTALERAMANPWGPGELSLSMVPPENSMNVK